MLKLVGIRGTNASRTVGPTPLVVGRSRSTDWPIRNNQVSSKHLRVWASEGFVWIEDLGAKNGTTVNGQALSGKQTIRPGDVIGLGGFADLELRQVAGSELSAELDAFLQDLPGGLPPGAEPLQERIGALIRERDAAVWAAEQFPRFVRAATEGPLLQELVGLVASVSEASAVWALRWTGDGAALQIESMATAGATSDAPDPSDLSTSILVQTAQSGEATWADDALADPAFSSAQSVHALRLRSVGCIPLGQRGALWLSDADRANAFDSRCRAMVEALCAVCRPLLELDSDERERAGPQRRVPPIPGVVGRSPPMQALAQTVHAFAPMPWPVLILGETGTGKELVARGIHTLSRRGGDFVPVNCGAIPESLAESTIFGHERGAFTGADRRHQGVVERVGAGTLFLDEIGDLPAPLQVKLLRLLQEGTYTPVGATREQTFRGRIVAATHVAIDDDDARGSFRDDLYYRLAACVVRVPPLRDRHQDIPALVEHLIDRAVGQLPHVERLELAPDAAQLLRSRPWSGNVRELENAIRPAIAHCLAQGASTLRAEHFQGVGPAPAASGTALPWEVSNLHAATEEFQRERVRRALQEADGNRSKACEALAVSRQWLYRLLARWPDHGL